MATVQHYVTAGDELSVILPHSEVCMHMRVAGKRMQVRYLGDRAGVQLLTDAGGDFSFPILPGEAGFYRDGETGQHYTYIETETEPAAVVLRFPGFPPIRGVGPAITEIPA